MTSLNISIPRHKIVHCFSQWTALSALRSGSPVKSGDVIYPFLKMKAVAEVLDSDLPISKHEFDLWHKSKLEDISNSTNGKLPIGWSAKIINVYLKSMTYIGLIGRPGLIALIHPPIDSGLWLGLEAKYKNESEIWSNIRSKKRIKDIRSYAEYSTIIDGMKMVAQKENCLLIEVE